MEFSDNKSNSNILLPIEITLQIIVRLDGDGETCLENIVNSGIFGFTSNELSNLRSSIFYKALKFDLLKKNQNLVGLFDKGHKGRVQRYNKLVRGLVLRSPERFVSLTAPYITQKFLPDRTNFDDETKEPAYYYPIDEQSVDFWNRVYETERMLKRFKVASLWKRSQEKIMGDCDDLVIRLQKNIHEFGVNDSISGLAYKMEHLFAKVILFQNLHFAEIEHDNRPPGFKK